MSESDQFKVSYEKNNIYRIGSLKNSNAKVYTQKCLNWSDSDMEKHDDLSVLKHLWWFPSSTLLDL